MYIEGATGGTGDMKLSIEKRMDGKNSLGVFTFGTEKGCMVPVYVKRSDTKEEYDALLIESKLYKEEMKSMKGRIPVFHCVFTSLDKNFNFRALFLYSYPTRRISLEEIISNDFYR